jgi:hypothetical protein
MTYEYRRATWDEVTELGPQGWRLVPVPPIAEMRNVLGQPQMGDPLYAMEREMPGGKAADPDPGKKWLSDSARAGGAGGLITAPR